MMAVEKDRPTRVEEAVELIAAELERIQTATGKRIAWHEIRRQVEHRVFPMHGKRAA